MKYTELVNKRASKEGYEIFTQQITSCLEFSEVVVTPISTVPVLYT